MTSTVSSFVIAPYVLESSLSVCLLKILQISTHPRPYNHRNRLFFFCSFFSVYDVSLLSSRRVTLSSTCNSNLSIAIADGSPQIAFAVPTINGEESSQRLKLMVLSSSLLNNLFTIICPIAMHRMYLSIKFFQ